MLDLTTKKAIHTACVAQVADKRQTIQQRLDDIQDSLGAETKSSVGDKYETGRAMLHLEKDKIMQQLATVLHSKKLLAQLDPTQSYSTAQQGALVQTNQGTYYLGVSLGKITIEKTPYFAISLASPIGQLLLQKKVGETILFRQEEFTILHII